MKLFSATAPTTALALTGAALLALSPLAVQAQSPDQGFFIDARVGQTDLKDVSASDDTGFALGGGYWFNRAFAVEAGYTQLYDKRQVGGDLELDGFYAGLKGRALFDRGDGSGFFLGGRGGLFVWDGQAGAFSDDGSDWYLGAFAGYQITRNLGLSVNYDRFNADDLDADLLSAGIEYRF
ncbi:MAG: porin family protein [Xanthomonadales bacterium]|nr:porin family protein [Xanthomonadales bacterium]